MRLERFWATPNPREQALGPYACQMRPRHAHFLAEQPVKGQLS